MSKKPTQPFLAVRKRRSAMGNEGRFPPIRLSADYRFRSETIA
jgi:hypothetical protein